MTVTASKLGSSPITLDWTNFTNTSPGAGSAQSRNVLSPSEAWTKLKARFEQVEVGFYNSPIDPTLSQINETQALADELRRENDFTDCLF